MSKLETEFCIETEWEGKRNFVGFGFLEQAERNWHLFHERGLKPGPIHGVVIVGGHWRPGRIVKHMSPKKE